ncbi:MAG TPA: AraC family transcriptional regulator, partial [Puia sp.]
MKHVSILVPKGECSITNIEGTYQILLRVNAWLEEAGEPPLFNVQLVGLERETRMKNGLFSISPDVMVREVSRTDLILVPSVHGDKEAILKENKPMLDWIVERYRDGA